MSQPATKRMRFDLTPAYFSAEQFLNKKSSLWTADDAKKLMTDGTTIYALVKMNTAADIDKLAGTGAEFGVKELDQVSVTRATFTQCLNSAQTQSELQERCERLESEIEELRALLQVKRNSQRAARGAAPIDDDDDDDEIVGEDGKPLDDKSSAGQFGASSKT